MNTSSFNIFGRVTATPELRYTPSGKAVINFTIAENITYKSGSEKKEKALFHKFEYWEKAAEHYAKYIEKGSPVVVFGATVTHKQHKTEGGYLINETIFTGGKIKFLPTTTQKFTANEEEAPIFLTEANDFHEESIPF